MLRNVEQYCVSQGNMAISRNIRSTNQAKLGSDWLSGYNAMLCDTEILCDMEIPCAMEISHAMGISHNVGISRENKIAWPADHTLKKL